MLGSDPDEPPTSTIGPKLESFLKAGNSQSSRTQKPYYVLTKKKDDGEDEKEEKQTENVGLLPMLLRSAKDDLKFVGNVIKYALAWFIFLRKRPSLICLSWMKKTAFAQIVSDFFNAKLWWSDEDVK